MTKIYFTPGPSQLYPTVERHIQTALAEQVGSLSHRSDAFKQLYAAADQNLRTLLKVPKDYHILFFSSATEIWDRLLHSFPGKAFFFVNGSFSERFRSFARNIGCEESSYEVPFGQGFESGKARLPEGTVFCGMIGNETSSGVMTPPEDYYEVAARNPDTLCFVDLVSGWPAYPLDLEKVDGAYFSVQKGFGLPAGVGVLIASPRAVEKVREDEANGHFRGNHRSLAAMADKAAKRQTVETPNVLGLYLLGKVAQDMTDQSYALYTDSQEKAELLYRFFDSHARWQPAVDTPRWRSETVVVLDTPNTASEIIQSLSEKGFVVGSGYGSRKADQIRIANFPAVSIDDVNALIKAFSAL